MHLLTNICCSEILFIVVELENDAHNRAAFFYFFSKNYIHSFNVLKHNPIRLTLTIQSLFILLLLPSIGFSQPFSISRYYDISDGLPSNHVYKCLQDKKGFMWVATENGLSRFDGNSFKNFTVKDGLPDNDILDIFLDSAGNVWMIPFAKNPAYMDAKTNRIVNAMVEPELGKITGKNYLLGHALINGDVVFYDMSSHGYIFSTHYKKANKLRLNPAYYFTKVYDSELEISDSAFKYYRNGILTKSVTSPIAHLGLGRVGEENDKLLFLRADSSIIQLSKFDKNLTPDILIKKFPFRAWTVTYLKNYIGIATRNGLICLADKNTMEVKFEIDPGALVKNLSEDSDGNLWVATDDKGIIKIGKPLLGRAVVKSKVYKDVLSLLIDSTGLICGNVSGDVFEYRNGILRSQKIIAEKSMYNNFFVKKFIKTQKGIYVASFQGLFLKTGTAYKRVSIFKGYKDAIMVNDSILLLGSFDALYKHNIFSDKSTLLVKHRSSSVTIDTIGNIYLGANDGLFKWRRGNLENISEKNIAFTNSVTKLYTTKDNIVWIAFSSDTLMAMRNDSLLLKIPLSNLSQGSICKSLGANEPGTIWAGTDRSLVKIKYTVEGSEMTYSSIPFSKADGLSDGQVNDIAFFGNSVYVATTSGINQFNCNETPVIKNIPTYITGLFVNGKSVDVNGLIELNPTENNLEIEFSGVELSGYNPVFQFKINEGNWQSISGNSLILSALKPGNYSFNIRALKKNLQPSEKVAMLNLKIRTPFLQKPITIVSFLLVLFIFALYLINKWKSVKQNRKQKEQQALEKQRHQITADLHDDIGASLSSLQLNSAIAVQVFDKNPRQSKEMLLKVEDQSQQLAEKIGDFIWSMKPREDEFMTISSRIKTYTNEILGDTTIIHHISIDNKIDIANFTLRKNILLIVKEAVNNAAKYSKATNLYLQLKIAGNKILLTIQDDGIGMNEQKAAGNGLANMKKRSEEMNGVFEIETGTEKGVKISVVIPCP